MIPGLPFCVPTGLSKNFWTYWIPLLACESLLCALALFRAFAGGFSDSVQDARNPRQTRGRRAWRGDGGAIARRLMNVFRNGQRIVDVLIRDSILYFLVYVLSPHVCMLSPPLYRNRALTRPRA